MHEHNPVPGMNPHIFALTASKILQHQSFVWVILVKCFQFRRAYVHNIHQNQAQYVMQTKPRTTQIKNKASDVHLRLRIAD